MPSLLFEEVFELFVELADLASRIHEMMPAACPSRVGFGINIQLQDITFFAPGRAGLEGGPVRQFHGNQVVIGMNVFFHGLKTLWRDAMHPLSSAPYSLGRRATQVISLPSCERKIAGTVCACYRCANAESSIATHGRKEPIF